MNTTKKTNAEYLAAVEAGDMATAQRMVDEAANKAGVLEEPNLSSLTIEADLAWRDFVSAAVNAAFPAVVTRLWNGTLMRFSPGLYYGISAVEIGVLTPEAKAVMDRAYNRFHHYFNDESVVPQDIRDGFARRDQIGKDLSAQWERVQQKQGLAFQRWKGFLNAQKGTEVFVRFGKPPANGNSFNSRDQFYENGTSAYKGKLTKYGVIIRPVRDSYSGMFIIGSRPMYISRNAIEKDDLGSDGEPLVEPGARWSKFSGSYIIISESSKLDPVTRDAEGRVIPLSERFDPQRDDIRNNQ